MADTEGMSMKYTVLKNDDIEKYIDSRNSDRLSVALRQVCREIRVQRDIDGKRQNTYVVINTDEPYADQVIEIMKSYGHWG